MLGLVDVRDFIAGLGLAADDHVYCRRLNNKKEQSIGVYRLERTGSPNIPIGGIENSSYGVKPVSILIHWNKSIRDTEAAAEQLFYTLLNTRNVEVNGNRIKFIRLLMPEPVDVGTDSDIYEMVIEMEIYFER
ncbi:MAG: minor capsid protein [Alistipes sp.]|nr:minor capsid protein [Alistipes sp.]